MKTNSGEWMKLRPVLAWNSQEHMTIHQPERRVQSFIWRSSLVPIICAVPVRDRRNSPWFRNIFQDHENVAGRQCCTPAYIIMLVHIFLVRNCLKQNEVHTAFEEDSMGFAKVSPFLALTVPFFLLPLLFKIIRRSVSRAAEPGNVICFITRNTLVQNRCQCFLLKKGQG